jgi:hypothetical protein
MSDEEKFAAADSYAHLLAPTGSTCWWCGTRPATTGEHKFKRSDLAQLMDPGNELIWSDGKSVREIRGRSGINRDRYGVVKFPKSMCEPCNNVRSKPFDAAYDAYSSYTRGTWVRIAPGLDLRSVYGDGWPQGAINLARYHAKHFGCRMVKDRFPVPDSLRSFLNGASDMPDGLMSIVSTDEVHRQYGKGLSISPGFVDIDSKRTRFERCVMVAYVGSIGIRYEWRRGGVPDDERSQFFHYPFPVTNFFRTEVDVAYGHPRKPGRFARFMQWLNKPS